MTADHIIEKIREENASLAADRDAWIVAANAQMKRARAAEAERDALRKALEPFCKYKTADGLPGPAENSR